MIDYGAPPAGDEIEITLFGPGYGEAIAVHLGEGAWLLADSCIDPDSKEPASGTYLEEIGVGNDQVRSIVASHWHDDHVRGISRLAEKYSEAEFVISATLNDGEAAAFLAAYSGQSGSRLSRGTKELFHVINDRDAVFPALHRSAVFEATLNGRQVRVSALSPLPAAFHRFVAHMAEYRAWHNGAINFAPDLRPNTEAVALHIDLGDDAALLGADLEEHSKFGWSALIADRWSGARRPATAYKVAHHGSETGDCSKIWGVMLQPDPVACLTPFINGKHRLPTDNDKRRVKQFSKKCYISSGASRRPDMDSNVLKRLGDIATNVARVVTGFGAVRLRKHLGSAAWRVELFGAAQRI